MLRRSPRTVRPVAAGQRNCAVHVQQMTEGVDTEHAPTQTWSTLVNPYFCSRYDVEGDERFTADQLSAPMRTMWNGPYRSDMDPDLVDVAKQLRFVFRSRTYEVIAGFVIGEREGLEFLTLARNG